MTVLDLRVRPGAVDDAAQLARPRPAARRGAERGVERARPRRGERRRAPGRPARCACPRRRSSPAGLPVVAGVAEDAEQVVAQLERLAERQPEAAELLERPSGVRAGQRGADVERPLDGVLGGLVAQHRHRGVDVGAAAGLHGDVEELAGDHLGAAQVEDVERRSDARQRQPAAAQQLVGPGRAAGRRAGSRRRRRTARGRRASRRRGARPRRRGASRAGRGGCRRRPCSRRGRARWRAAAPARRRPGPARRSSAGAAADGAVAPVAERRAEPLAAATTECAPRRPARAASGPSGASRSACSSRKASSDLLDPVAEAGGVPGSVTRASLSTGRRVGRSRSRPPPYLDRRMTHGTRTQHAASCSRGGDRSFSFEFFPPKDEAGEEQLWQAITRARALPADVRVGDLRRRRHHARHARSAITGRIARETSHAPDRRT